MPGSPRPSPHWGRHEPPKSRCYAENNAKTTQKMGEKMVNPTHPTQSWLCSCFLSPASQSEQPRARTAAHTPSSDQEADLRAQTHEVSGLQAGPARAGRVPGQLAPPLPPHREAKTQPQNRISSPPPRPNVTTVIASVEGTARKIRPPRAQQ